MYDAGTLVGFNYDNGSTNANYYYGIDNFGNINYIYDASGNIVVTYRYDAWGKPISTTGTLASTVGAANPYRYKSYYYDTETESRTYGNTNWIDQLTNINGTAITYDNLGNPLKWHNASAITWNGRRMKTFTKPAMHEFKIT